MVLFDFILLGLFPKRVYKSFAEFIESKVVHAAEDQEKEVKWKVWISET